MANNDYICIVKNRSSNRVVYSIPELGVKRSFSPGESKQIAYSELAKLTYTPGGRNVINKYLYIQKKDVTDALGVHREPEYDWDESRIKQLLTTDSLEQFLDCLDFAPEGVISILKDMAVKLPLGDPMKKKALREKTGVDVDAIYRNTIEGEEGEIVETKKQRRVTKDSSTQPIRRYNVVNS